MWREEQKVIDKAFATDDFSTLGEDLDRILFETTGLTEDQLSFLSSIHLEKNPEDRGGDFDIITHDLVGVYLKLSFLYPEKSIPELFDLFREAAENGETHVRLEVVERIYGIEV